MKNRIIELLKKHKKRIVAYGIIGFVICLLIVQVPYWIGSIKTIIRTDFEAADVLAFLGSFLSALGTVILGWIAVKQADQANEISDRLLKIEEQRYIDEHKPIVVVDWVKLHDSLYGNIAKNVNYTGRLYYVNSPLYDLNAKDGFWEINIINTGCTGIYNCIVEKVISIPEELILDCSCSESGARPFNLKISENMELNLYVNLDVIERYAQKKIETIMLQLRCINDFGEKYRITLSVSGNAIEYTNRYEQMLIPTPHSVKWDIKCEKINDN